MQRGEVAPSDMICGTGMTAWNRITWWRAELQNLINFRPAPLPMVETPTRQQSKPAEPAAPVTAAVTVASAPVEEPTGLFLGGEQTLVTHVRSEAPTVQLGLQNAAAPAPSEAWHYALAGQTYGPYNHAELIHELETADPLHEVALWTRGMREWAPIYEFHGILSDLNANKRSFPRAELDGDVVLTADGLTYHAQILTISEGGLGVRLESPPPPGQMCVCEVQSPHLGKAFTCKVDVRFSVGGVTGLRFTEVTEEAKNKIGEFVRQSYLAVVQNRAA